MPAKIPAGFQTDESKNPAEIGKRLIDFLCLIPPLLGLFVLFAILFHVKLPPFDVFNLMEFNTKRFKKMNTFDFFKCNLSSRLIDLILFF